MSQSTLVTALRSKVTSSHRGAADTLDDVALDAFHQSVRIDDLSAIVRHGELARPDLAGRAVDIHFGDDGNPRPVTLRVGEATARHLVSGLIAPRRGPRLPSGFFGNRLEQRNIARFLYMAQPEFDRIDIEGSSHLVNERLAGKVDLRPDRIAQMRRAQRR